MPSSRVSGARRLWEILGGPSRKTARRLIFVVAFAALSAVDQAPVAQESKPDPAPPTDFIYASQLGTGIYNVAGRVVQVYRIPINIRLRTIEDDGWGSDCDSR